MVERKFEFLEDFAMTDCKDYKLSKSCNLDGRYFETVLSEYPGVSKFPIRVEMLPRMISNASKFPTKIGMVSRMTPGDFHKELVMTTIKVINLEWRSDVLNIVRIVVVTPTLKHSVVLFVDTKRKLAELWDPVESDMDDKYVDGLEEAVYFQIIPDDCKFEYIRIPFESSFPSGCKEGRRGYCNAYILREAINRLFEMDYDVSTSNDIRCFVAAVEANYQDDLVGMPDIEYGRGFGGGGLGLGLGLLGGVALGSALSR